MTLSRQLQTLILVVGDLVLFYIGLYLTLTLRYQNWVKEEVWQEHTFPFLFVHLLWLFIFYISGSYDTKAFISYKRILEGILKTMIIASLFAALIFYLIPSIKIAPKTNLFIDIIIVSLLLILWRRIFWNITKKATQFKILLLGDPKETGGFVELLKNNPQLGYDPTIVLESIDTDTVRLIKQSKIQLIVASKNMFTDNQAARKFYEIMPLGISAIDLAKFYESLVEKIPVSMINEDWFLENLMEINKRAFEKFKRAFDIISSVILGIPAVIISPFISFLIKIESRGPILYKQKRVGKNEKIFEIIKFRTMVKNAEKNGAEWAQKKDKRITRIGKFLRTTRLDELPQILNILKGDMSFVGPRPERPKFVKELKKEISHYRMRHLVKPGLSGWAQIKYPYGSSVKDAREKLRYDLYYIKNRSFILDLAITAKTIATIVTRQGR